MEIKKYFPLSKEIRIPITADSTLRVGCEMDSTIHFDDQIQVFQIADRYLGLILADGVSTSAGGRLASVSLCEYIPQYFETVKNGSLKPEWKLDQLCLNAVHYAVKKIKEEITFAKLKSDLTPAAQKETLWSTHDQVEVPVTRNGGPNW